MLPRGYLSSLLAIACVVLAWTACAGGDQRAGGGAGSGDPSATGDTWDITVTFETLSDAQSRTDEFTFAGAVFDGDEHVMPAQWKLCVEGAQEGCAAAAAECVFRGDATPDAERHFEIRCDDHSDDDEEDTPCATLTAVEFCAIAGTLTTDPSQCDDDDYARWDDPVFCTRPLDSNASTVTGGGGRELGPSRYGARWKFQRRDDHDAGSW